MGTRLRCANFILIPAAISNADTNADHTNANAAAYVWVRLDHTEGFRGRVERRCAIHRLSRWTTSRWNPDGVRTTRQRRQQFHKPGRRLGLWIAPGADKVHQRRLRWFDERGSEPLC